MAHNILNISPLSTLEEIESAYYRLATQWHPDRNKSPEAEKKFNEITEAYEYLVKQHKNRNIKVNNTKVIHMSSVNSTILDILNNLKQNLYHKTISLTFDSLYKGATCLEIVEIGNNKRMVKVNVEPGTVQNTKLKYNIDNATVIFTVIEKPHAIYKRKGYDIHYQHKLHLKDYINGFEIKVPLINGTYKKIKHRYGGSTLSGYIKPLKLVGEGMPKGNSDIYGDMYIELLIQLPDNV